MPELINKVESESKSKNFDPILFQPVRGPGVYEGEFGAKENDIIFHFWPDKYHFLDAQGKQPPVFNKKFKPTLEAVFTEVFGNGKFEIAQDDDMGAFFVKVFHGTVNTFHKKLSIDACEKIYTALTKSK